MHLCVYPVFPLLGLWRDKLSLVHLCFFTLVEPIFCFWLPQCGKGLMHLCLCQVFRLLEALVCSSLSCLVDAKLTVETQCGLVCRSSRQELLETLYAKNISIFPHWARQWPLPQCGLQSPQLSPPKVLDLHMKQLLYAIEQSFLDHADCNFSSSRNNYVCYTNLA